jgi:hypothetical protein
MDPVNLTCGGDQKNRRELDFYPTPPEVTHALMQFLSLDPSRVWEPACGNGVMANVIKQYGHDVIASDLRETGYGEGGWSFMDRMRTCDAIITNPPFALSEQFIRHALTCAGTVAMLLKSQYWHANKRMKLFGEHPPSWVLPLTWRPDFLFDQRIEGGKRAAPTMEVAWSVWIASDVSGYTKYFPLGKPKINPTQEALI